MNPLLEDALAQSDVTMPMLNRSDLYAYTYYVKMSSIIFNIFESIQQVHVLIFSQVSTSKRAFCYLNRAPVHEIHNGYHVVFETAAMPVFVSLFMAKTCCAHTYVLPLYQRQVVMHVERQGAMIT